MTVTNSTFSGNSATAYGGAIESGSGTLTVTNSTFSNNSAANGGGIFNNLASVTVGNSTFTANSAPSSVNGIGGGIGNSGTLTVTNSTFSGNSGTYGGGIGNNGGSGTVTNSTFASNSAPSSDGGGIYSTGVVGLTVTNCTFFGNSASIGGGTFDEEALTITNSILADSTLAEIVQGIRHLRAFSTNGGYNISDDASCGFNQGCSSSKCTADNGDTIGDNVSDVSLEPRRRPRK